MNHGSRVRRWGAMAAEACGSLLIVLALYWLFMLFLNAMFPSGTALRELMGTGTEPEAEAVRPGWGGGPDATLTSLQRDVRFRRGNSVAWGGASEGMQLYSHDAVQTLDDSGARIFFGAKDQLQMGSNSLIVVTRLDESDVTGPRSYRVKVDGEVRGTLAAGRKLNMEVEAAGHTARFAPGGARFRMLRNGADSSSLAVFAGVARVQDRGRSVLVRANQGVTMHKKGGIGKVVPLPSPPALGENEAGLHRYRLLPPKVRFTWSGGKGEYHFQLARDPEFRKCEVDRRVTGAEVVTGKLDKGSYYWRVSRVHEGVEGSFSRVGSCRLRQQLDVPPLSVNFPPDSGAAGPCALTGSVRPGSRLFVDGVEVSPQPDGAFSHELRLKAGVNLIRVEAFDPTGNASYSSRIVYRRNPGTGEAEAAGVAGAAPAGEAIKKGGPEWKKD